MGLSLESHICTGSHATDDVLGLVIGSGGMSCRPGTRFLEQLPKGLGNEKTVEHRLALCHAGKALWSAGEWRSRE